LDKNFIEQELKIFAKEQTILLMQSSDEDIKTLQNSLGQFFKSVVVAKDYESAKTEYIKSDFDIVIISVDFEGKFGGLKACKQIRDRAEDQVIILTGSLTSHMDTDMFIDLMELKVATFVPHLLSVEFVLMKVMEQSEKIVYHKVEVENRKQITQKAKEEKKEIIKSKKENKEESKKYIESTKAIDKDIVKIVNQDKVCAIDFIEELAKKDDFKLLKYTIDNLNDLHYDFEKLIFDMVSNTSMREELKDELVDILFHYEDSLKKLGRFEKLADMFGMLGYYVYDIELQNFNKKAFDVMWYLNDDLKKLVHHIFIKKDVENIHFLDESIISSLLQLKGSLDKTKTEIEEEELEIF
jgi:DNA-binding NarL/FixJ family response regulator